VAVKYRGSAHGKLTSATTIPITLPAGSAKDDYAVIEATSNNTATVWTTPTGWSLLAESTRSTENGGKHSWAIFTRKLTSALGEENVPTLKSSVEGSLEYSVMVAEAGTYDTANPIDAHSPGWQESVAADPLEVSMSGGTASVAGDLLLLFLSEGQNPAAAPAGFAKAGEGTFTYLYTKLEAPSGAISAVVTKTTKVGYNGFLVAIKATAEGVAIPIPLNAAASTSSASMALTATSGVPLQAAASVSGASLAMVVQTAVPLQLATSSSGATLAMTMETRVLLEAANSTSGATLVIARNTQVPLQPAPSASSATALALGTLTPLPLGASTSTSGASCGIVIALATRDCLITITSRAAARIDITDVPAAEITITNRPAARIAITTEA
jgi:hypothetical protein